MQRHDRRAWASRGIIAVVAAVALAHAPATGAAVAVSRAPAFVVERSAGSARVALRGRKVQGRVFAGRILVLDQRRRVLRSRQTPPRPGFPGSASGPGPRCTIGSAPHRGFSFPDRWHVARSELGSLSSVFQSFVHRRARRLTSSDDRHSYLTEQIGLCFGAQAHPRTGLRLIRLAVSATLATRAPHLIGFAGGEGSGRGRVTLERDDVFPLRGSLFRHSGEVRGSQDPEEGIALGEPYTHNEFSGTWESRAGTTGREGNVASALWELRDGTRPPPIRFGVSATYACASQAACTAR